MKGTEMKSLTISWTLCDGRLTAKWSEQANERPLTSALWETAPAAKSSTAMASNDVRPQRLSFAIAWAAGKLFNKTL